MVKCWLWRAAGPPSPRPQRRGWLRSNRLIDTTLWPSRQRASCWSTLRARLARRELRTGPRLHGAKRAPVARDAPREHSGSSEAGQTGQGAAGRRIGKLGSPGAFDYTLQRIAKCEERRDELSTTRLVMPANIGRVTVRRHR